MKKIFFILFLLPILSFSQSNEEKMFAYRYSLGLGIHEGGGETGIGVMGSFGVLKSIGKKKKSRINSNFTLGRFADLIITDVPSQKYFYFSLDVKYHFDLLRYKAFSIVTSAGGYFSLTSGKIEDFYGKDGLFRPGTKFTHPYLMASISGGLRIAPKNSKIAVNITPFNIQLGTSYSYLGAFYLSLDFKLNK